MWKNILGRDRPQIKIWRMRIACWITKAANPHSQYVTLIAFPLQQSLHERSLVLRYTYIACIVCGCSRTLPAVAVPVFRISYGSRSPSIFSTTFQNFPGNCDLLSEGSKFHLQMYHFTSIFPNSSPVSWRTGSSSSSSSC
jgi:hypothetical protein